MCFFFDYLIIKISFYNTKLIRLFDLMQNIRRFVFTGPESSGKTSLSELIAGHFDFVLVTEYARQYLESLQGNYTISDVFAIALHQQQLEENIAATTTTPLICDTDLSVIYIWLAFKYRYHSDKMMDTIKSGLAHTHYFLCYPDVEWEDDPLRENPDNREELFEMYDNLLKSLGANYTILKGSLKQRAEVCITQIQNHVS